MRIRQHAYSLIAITLSVAEVGAVFGLTSSAYTATAFVPGSGLARRLVLANLALSVGSVALCALAAAKERPKALAAAAAVIACIAFVLCGFRLAV
ncbi:MAG: hypothetical protein DMG22_20840 [Acidobacteria bacterium]|nr:MAG: hypothetical protein DMG22_20840 [Acidobacteriota bacterium]